MLSLRTCPGRFHPPVEGGATPLRSTPHPCSSCCVQKSFAATIGKEKAGLAGPSLAFGPEIWHIRTAMLSQLAVRAARPEAIRQKRAEERALRGGLAQGGLEAIPKGSAARVKPPIHEARFVRIEASSGAACEEGAPKPGFARSQREDGAMRATRFKDRTTAAPARSFDVRPAIHRSGLASGLYDPALEKDSCGVGFIADIKGRKSHKIVDDALKILLNLEHRGAVGAEPRAGAGAGILVQIPHKFFARKAAEPGIDLPEPGHYAVGHAFLPRDPQWRQVILDVYADVVAREGQVLLGWREVPSDNASLGEAVVPTDAVP